MARTSDLHTAERRRGPAAWSDAPDWTRLLGRVRACEALEEIGRWLAPNVVELSLSGDAQEPVTWRAEGSAAAARGEAVIPGAPPWRLALALAPGSRGATAAALEHAASALGAWRAARAGITRTENRLLARSRELDLLSGLGRRAAEARDLHELFGRAAAVLAPALELDLVLAAWQEEGRASRELFLARPFAEDYLLELERRALSFLGAGGGDAGRRMERLESWDEGRGIRGAFDEADLLLLPLLRQTRPAACLIVVAAGEIDEPRLRPLYGAANLLTLHLARILAVREAEADRFRAIVDSMPQGVVLADLDLRPLQMNASARRMLESIGGPIEPGAAPVLGRTGARELVARLAAGEAGPLEGEIQPGLDRVWGVTVSALSGEAGLEGIVIVLADITDRRRMQEQLAQAEKMSSLGQMISGVAHELNNPLASILGYCQLLRLKGVDERLPERLETLAREAERCRKIVQSLLSFARWRPAERRPLSLNQVVRDVHGLLAYQLRVDDVAVALELDLDLPVMHGDAHQLGQMLVNLLTNARQALREAGRPGTVAVRTRAGEGAFVLLDVRDDGPGIPPEIRARIFDPFFTTKRAGQGTGLGLALVYSIVTGHGGTVDVRSPAEGGSLFRIALPCGRPAEPDRTVEPCPAPHSPRMQRPGKILVVEDEEALARLICDTLEHDGHSTSSVTDARQALERVAGEEFDLVVSDVRMPGIGADRLHEELSSLNPRLARSMLLTTGDTLGSAAQEIAARTGLEVLAKPFDLADLRRRVQARLASQD